MIGKLAISGIVCCATVMGVFKSSASANIYVSGTAGYGLYTYAYSSPNAKTDDRPAPHGIVPYYKDAANAIVSGTMGTSFSSANTTFSVNSNSLGLIEGDTVGVFSQLMFGSVSRPGGLTTIPVNYAGLNNDFGTIFITGSYYEYSISVEFSNYTSKSTARTYLVNRDTNVDVFRATSDLAHTVYGSATGILAPGIYLFESSITLSAFHPNSFDDNRISTTLTLTPIAAPVPEPEILVLFALGLSVLPYYRRKYGQKKKNRVIALNLPSCADLRC